MSLSPPVRDRDPTRVPGSDDGGWRHGRGGRLELRKKTSHARGSLPPEAKKVLHRWSGKL